MAGGGLTQQHASTSETAPTTKAQRGEAAYPCQATQRQPCILLQELQLAQVQAHQAQQQLA